MRCPRVRELPPAPPGKTGWPWTDESPLLADTMPDGSPWPRISIVTPSFNQEGFLEETIRSVLLQGYPDLEYMIIDGGSTDNSVEIIRKYERWLAYWVSDHDRGQTHAINKGWEKATGDVISWLNSDDFLMQEWARVAVLSLVGDTGTDLVCVDALMVDRQSQPLSVFRGTTQTLETTITYWFTPFPQQGFLMRRRVLQQCGPLDEQFQFAMDFEYWVRLLTEGKQFKYVPRILAAHRLHPAAKTATMYHTAIRDLLRVTEKFFDGAPPSLRVTAENAERHRYWNAANSALWMGDQRLARQYAWRYLRRAGVPKLPKVLAFYLITLFGKAGQQLLRLYRSSRKRHGQSALTELTSAAAR